MGEKELMNYVTIITIIVSGVLVMRMIRKKIKKRLGHANKEPELPADILNDYINTLSFGNSKNPREETVPIYEVNNPAEAVSLRALLEDNGINCLIYSFDDFGYDAVRQLQKGWGVLRVLERDKSKAEELIKNHLNMNKEDIFNLSDAYEFKKKKISSNLLFKIVTIVLLIISFVILDQTAMLSFIVNLIRGKR